jgi:uncharacterized protein (TIGR03437 family)
VQATDRNFYGTTTSGGAGYQGTVFRISAGLHPFARPVPLAAKAGKSVTILGTNLTGTSSVTFSGVAAEFAFVSSTEIKATVPLAAVDGNVEVVTPGGILVSNVPFRVLS